jgi:hypothetical protein
MIDNVTRLAEKISYTPGITWTDIEGRERGISEIESLLREAMDDARAEGLNVAAGAIPLAMNQAYTRAAEVARKWAIKRMIRGEDVVCVTDGIAAAIEKLREDK